MVASSGVLSSTNTFSGTIAVPLNIIPGDLRRMRLVLLTSSVTDDVRPCGTFAEGETQDYKLKIIASSVPDVAVANLLSPSMSRLAAIPKGTSP